MSLRVGRFPCSGRTLSATTAVVGSASFALLCEVYGPRVLPLGVSFNAGSFGVKTAHRGDGDAAGSAYRSLVSAQPALGLLAAAPRAAPRHDTARAWSSRRRAACRAAKSMPRGSLRGGGDAAGLAYRALERCVARGVQPAAPMAPGVAEPRAAPRTRWRCGLHAGRRSAVNFSALDTRYRSDVTRGVRSMSQYGYGSM